MKNKEEPSIGSTSGNPSPPADRHIPGCVREETTGSIVRQDGAALASIEKPASHASIERQRQWPAVLPTLPPLTRHQSTDPRQLFVEPPYAVPHVRWCGKGGPQGPPLPDFWRFFGLRFVLVLSAAVLVIVIDLSIIRCARLGHTSEFRRHPSQHRHDPVQHRFHRIIILNLDAFGRHQYILNRGTLQNRTACNVQKSSTIFEATFTVALGNVQWDRLRSVQPLIASMSIKPFEWL